MQIKKGFAATLFGAIIAIALVMTVTACGPKVVLAGDWVDGNYVATADRCKGGDMMVIGITVEEGNDTLVVSSELESGALHVALGAPMGGSDEENPDLSVPDSFIVECDATGTGEQTFAVEPGDYSLTVEGVEGETTSGTVTISFTSQS